MIQVTLYTINNCNRCAALESVLKKSNISFDIIHGEKEIINLGFTKAPILKVGDNFMDFPEAYNWAIRGGVE